MTESRAFHLGDILTVTTDKLVSPGGFDGMWALVNFMTGDDLMTHQIPRACDECKPSLLAQHPDLAAVETPDWENVPRHRVKADVEAWLTQQVARYGEYLQVTPLADGDHTVIDPLTELAMNHPHLTVIPIVVTDSDGGDPR